MLSLREKNEREHFLIQLIHCTWTCLSVRVRRFLHGVVAASRRGRSARLPLWCIHDETQQRSVSDFCLCALVELEWTPGPHRLEFCVPLFPDWITPEVWRLGPYFLSSVSRFYNCGRQNCRCWFISTHIIASANLVSKQLETVSPCLMIRECIILTRFVCAVTFLKDF